MKKILVTGGNGQLGRELKALASASEYEFAFTDRLSLDITDKKRTELYFEQHPDFDFCVNCAAYTAVDQAEIEQGRAYLVNAEGVYNLADNCQRHGVKLFHVSTDYVFDGASHLPYTEADATSPTGAYGRSKREGEKIALETAPESAVFRTAWLYSSYGKNFMKTMSKLGAERDRLRVVADQVGTPTYARDLARAIMDFMGRDEETLSRLKGVYHFSNEGVASWYDFAHAIFAHTGAKAKLSPIRTSEYPTRAARPAYSVLDKGLLRREFGIEIRHWRDALAECMEESRKASH